MLGKAKWPLAPLCWLANMPAEKCHGTQAGNWYRFIFSSFTPERIPVFEGPILATVVLLGVLGVFSTNTLKISIIVS